MIKKVVSCAAALTLAFGGLSALPFEGILDTVITADAEDVLTYGDFKYTVLYDGTVEITKYQGSAKTVTVPAKIDGKRLQV